MLLHLTTPAAWRAALSVGAVAPPSLVVDGFVHLSSPEQVHIPYELFLGGRADTIVLVIDEARLAGAGEVRWEGGFPHLYGALTTAAVTSVVPYRAGGPWPDPDDRVARATAADRSLAERRAAAVVPFDGGVACLDPRVRHSWEHNTAWVDDPAAPWVEVADRYGLQRAVLPAAGPCPDGWLLHEQRLLVLAPPVEVDRSAEVRSVTSETMALLWGPSWRRDLPGIDDAAVDDLLRREAIADAHVRVVDLAVLDDGGVPVAGTQLRIDGATAAVEAVMTDPDHRGRRLATAVVTDAVARAAEAGCDVVWLVAAAGDWPRRWYERLGFVDAGARWEAQRST